MLALQGPYSNIISKDLQSTKIQMSNGPNEEEIKDIVEQLQRLQIQQTGLLTRLEVLNEGAAEENRPARNAGPATRAPRELAIGDSVRIKNPTPFQANKGTIVKINLATDRITIQPTTGAKIVRSSRNVLRVPT